MPFDTCKLHLLANLAVNTTRYALKPVIKLIITDFSAIMSSTHKELQTIP